MNTDSRLDEALPDDQQRRLRANVSHIGIASMDGVVTDAGHLAHDAAQAISVAKSWDAHFADDSNRDIKRHKPQPNRRSDAEITDAARGALEWDINVPDYTIDVLVSDGQVTLEGVVKWQYQKDAASRCVRYQTGVIGLNNRITIKPPAKWIGLANRIEDALRSVAGLEARRVPPIRVAHVGAIPAARADTDTARSADAAPQLSAITGSLSSGSIPVDDDRAQTVSAIRR